MPLEVCEETADLAISNANEINDLGRSFRKPLVRVGGGGVCEAVDSA